MLHRHVLILTLAAAFAVTLSAQSNSVPFVDSPLVPDSAAPGSGAFTLTVNGTGFTASSVVTWNGSPRATTFVNSLQLTATILASDVAAPGTGWVTVSTPAPGGGSSLPLYFPVIQPSSAVAFAPTILPSTVGNDLVVGDLNSDGKLDLVVSGSGSSIQVALGNGDGTFRAPQSIALGASGGGVALGDFNGDGKLDLAVALYGIDSVAILLGNGDGTFQSAKTFQSGQALFLALGDFNGDGKLDVAAASNSSGLAILLGNGDGTLKPAVYYSPGTYVDEIIVGDFNHDGRLDILSFNEIPSPAVFLGNGDGTFRAPVGALNLGGFAAVADLNGDGILDFAVFNGDQLSIALGKGDGTFLSPTQYTVEGANGPIAIGDFNGDGKQDIVVLASGIYTLLGNGDGTFQPPSLIPASICCSVVVAADFNGDGRLDLIDGPYLALQTTVALSPYSLTFPTLPVGRTSPPQTITVTNIGAAPITFTPSTVAGGAPSDYAVSNDTCAGAAVEPSGTCTVAVTFKPTEEAGRSAYLNFNDDAAGSPQQVSLQGEGIALRVAPAKLNFGSVKVHTISPQQLIEVTNTSTQSVRMKISIVGHGENDFLEEDSCSRPLAGKASCTIAVQFAPTKKGALNAGVAINAGTGISPKNVSLSGDGM